jgi:signal transduction histidine kinase
MQKNSYHLPFNPGIILAIGILSFLLAYTYGYFFKAPYLGFWFNTSNGNIVEVYITNSQESALLPEDQIIQVGTLTFKAFQKELDSPLFWESRPGQVVNIEVNRDGKVLDIPWTLPGWNTAEFLGRLASQWWLGFIFWIFGTLGLFFIQPRDERWWLFAGFNYLTAIWIIAGALSADFLWESPIIMRAAFWFCVPIYWHFHWNFPQPLKPARKLIWVVLYGLAFVLSIGEVLRTLPHNAFYIGFLLAIVGSLLLLIAHFFTSPMNRRELGVLGAGVLLMLIPLIGVSVGGLFRHLQSIGLVSVLALPVLPGTYFYIISRRQLGDMELRANRAIVMFIYAILLLTAVIIILPAASILFPSPEALISISAVLILGASHLTITIFPRFERWVQNILLRMPLPPAHLLETYTSRITTSLDEGRLTDLLRDQILPSLLIRKAALFRLNENLSPTIIFALGLKGDRLPLREDIPSLLTQSGRYRPISSEKKEEFLCPWARLILNLSVEGKPVGLLLLGRRDPDDFYGVNEIPTLQALAHQTALALINIQQAERLSSMYQRDIERQEAEHTRLAQELHDDVLSQLAMLMMNSGESATSPEFEQAYHLVVKSIREIIQGLRPAMLNYGLQMGIRELTEDLNTRSGSAIEINAQLPESQLRYPPAVELHLFRIVQQACQNTLQHALATNLNITCRLDQSHVELTVTDNGKGFEAGQELDLNGLLARRHFGLAGMYERAALINAQLHIVSSPNQGTKVCVIWNENG